MDTEQMMLSQMRTYSNSIFNTKSNLFGESSNAAVTQKKGFFQGFKSQNLKKNKKIKNEKKIEKFEDFENESSKSNFESPRADLLLEARYSSIQPSNQRNQKNSDLKNLNHDIKHLKRLWYDIYHIEDKYGDSRNIFLKNNLDYFNGITLIENQNIFEFIKLIIASFKSTILDFNSKICSRKAELEVEISKFETAKKKLSEKKIKCSTDGKKNQESPIVFRKKSNGDLNDPYSSIKPRNWINNLSSLDPNFRASKDTTEQLRAKKVKYRVPFEILKKKSSKRMSQKEIQNFLCSFNINEDSKLLNTTYDRNGTKLMDKSSLLEYSDTRILDSFNFNRNSSRSRNKLHLLNTLIHEEPRITFADKTSKKGQKFDNFLKKDKDNNTLRGSNYSRNVYNQEDEVVSPDEKKTERNDVKIEFGGGKYNHLIKQPSQTYTFNPSKLLKKTSKKSSKIGRSSSQKSAYKNEIEERSASNYKIVEKNNQRFLTEVNDFNSKGTYQQGVLSDSISNESIFTSKMNIHEDSEKRSDGNFTESNGDTHHNNRSEGYMSFRMQKKKSKIPIQEKNLEVKSVYKGSNYNFKKYHH